MHPLITSHQNSKIKNVILLEKARERKRQNAFVVEGVKELSLAIAGGYEINSVFYCPEIIPADAVIQLVGDENLLIPVVRAVFEKIAYRDSTGGILAVGNQQSICLTTSHCGKTRFC